LAGIAARRTDCAPGRSGRVAATPDITARLGEQHREVAVAMRPVLRGEEPAARDPVGGLGEVDRDAMATLDIPILAEMNYRLYCVSECLQCKDTATGKSNACQVNIDTVNIWKLRNRD
jgi:hypothetical protein